MTGLWRFVDYMLVLMNDLFIFAALEKKKRKSSNAVVIERCASIACWLTVMDSDDRWSAPGWQAGSD